MKSKGAAEKWASGILGVVCLLLLINLLRGGMGPGGEKTTLATARPPVERKILAKGTEAPKSDLLRYNPEIKLDLLDNLQSRDLPKFARNPFEFPKPPQPKIVPGPLNSQPNPPTQAVVTLPIKMIGYSEKPGGQKEGIASDDEGIYVIHEGETFNKRYKVNKLTANSATIYDEVTKQTVELPIAQ